ncbi:MAG: cysteine protease [Thelocarpon impressellum]|nr:MAG: cysteine protease [Thelocarpon impressellum]
MTTSTSIDLLQDFVTDCSLVASLCAAIASSERGHVKSTACDIYPYDEMLQRPIVSRNGKYVFRMNFNGCFRRVVIDDRLPSSRTGRVLHVVDRNKPGLLWPALVEKAYLKIRGGYDFPGSNSGTDLSVLTGWIPEQVFLHSDDVMLDQLWRRISDAFGLGDVLVTIGTGRLTKREEHELGLAGEHDYAILQMTECGEHRRMLVKNPWSEGTVWKGGVQPDPSAANDGDGFSLANDASSIQRLKPGTFWIDIHGVLQNFESIYLNWNPALFRHRQDIHISWDVSTVGPTGCFRGNPQFAVRSEGGGTLWLLLNRHFRNKQVSPDQPTTERKNPGYISLYVFLQDGRRVFLSDGALHRGPFVDSPNTLARLEPDLALLLETSSPSISTHVKLVWSDGGKRITGVSARDIAGESGEYRRGCALVTLRDVATGGYTIIVSTFEAGQLGDFALRAYSQTPCVITPLPAEGAGRLRTTPPLAVFPSGVNRLLAPMSVPRLTRLRCLASTSPSSSIPSSPIVLSLELAQGPNKTTLTTTGGGTHLDASHAALRTPDVDIAPAMALRGGAWLVVERLAGAGAGGEEGVRVEVLSEGPVEIGPWGMGEG